MCVCVLLYYYFFWAGGFPIVSGILFLFFFIFYFILFFAMFFFLFFFKFNGTQQFSRWFLCAWRRKNFLFFYIYFFLFLILLSSVSIRNHCCCYMTDSFIVVAYDDFSYSHFVLEANTRKKKTAEKVYQFFFLQNSHDFCSRFPWTFSSDINLEFN